MESSFVNEITFPKSTIDGTISISIETKTRQPSTKHSKNAKMADYLCTDLCEVF